MFKLSQLGLPARYLMKKKDKNSGGDDNKNNCIIGGDEEKKKEKDPSIIRDKVQRKTIKLIELENNQIQVEAKDKHKGPNNGLMRKPVPALSLAEREILFAPGSVIDAAAVKLQKTYRSYRTRRQLADCAVLVENLGWKALDFAVLKQSSVPFFNIEKRGSAVSPRARAKTRAAQVGKGSSKDDKAQKLALQHWLEAIDPKHRYGRNLHMYFDAWFDSESLEPFFYWLDVGEGRDVYLSECPRSALRSRPNKGEGGDMQNKGDENNGGGGGGDNNDDDDNNDGGDDDNNDGGGGQNNKKDNDHDGDCNGDRDKRGYDDGGEEMKGKNMDFMGESLFGYKFGYHTGNKNEYPVGKLQCVQEVQSSEPKCLLYNALIMIS